MLSGRGTPGRVDQDVYKRLAWSPGRLGALVTGAGVGVSANGVSDSEHPCRICDLGYSHFIDIFIVEGFTSGQDSYVLRFQGLGGVLILTRSPGARASHREQYP